MYPSNTSHAAQPPIQTRTTVSSKARAEESLPFTLKIVRTQAELNQAVLIRQAAYDRHLPEFAKSLVKPEAADFEKGTVVLLAESKEDGTTVGIEYLPRWVKIDVEDAKLLSAEL